MDGYKFNKFRGFSECGRRGRGKYCSSSLSAHEIEGESELSLSKSSHKDDSFLGFLRGASASVSSDVCHLFHLV